MKKTFYFPHDYHARHDPKLERLRMEFGPASDGIFWDIVEMLYEQGGYLSISEIPLYSKMLNANEQMFNKVVNTAFTKDGDRFYNQSLLDRLTHIEEVRKERSFAGKASGKSRQANKCSTHDEQVRNNIKEKKVKESIYIHHFTPPTVEEVTSYCKERLNAVDPKRFIDHYTANGWVRGKTKIKDWRACVRTWERNEKPKKEMNVL